MLLTSASSVGIHFPSASLFCWVGLFIFGLLLFAKPNRASDFYIYLFFFFLCKQHFSLIQGPDY